MEGGSCETDVMPKKCLCGIFLNLFQMMPLEIWLVLKMSHNQLCYFGQFIANHIGE